MRTIVKITRDEAEALRGRGLGNYVKHTWTKHKTYYMVETHDGTAQKALKAYRKTIGLES